MVLAWLTEGVVCSCQNDLQIASLQQHSYIEGNCFVHKSEVVLITFSAINTSYRIYSNGRRTPFSSPPRIDAAL